MSSDFGKISFEPALYSSGIVQALFSEQLRDVCCRQNNDWMTVVLDLLVCCGPNKASRYQDSELSMSQARYEPGDIFDSNAICDSLDFASSAKSTNIDEGPSPIRSCPIPSLPPSRDGLVTFSEVISGSSILAMAAAQCSNPCGLR